MLLLKILDLTILSQRLPVMKAGAFTFSLLNFILNIEDIIKKLSMFAVRSER